MYFRRFVKGIAEDAIVLMVLIVLDAARSNETKAESVNEHGSYQVA